MFRILVEYFLYQNFANLRKSYAKNHHITHIKFFYIILIIRLSNTIPYVTIAFSRGKY